MQVGLGFYVMVIGINNPDSAGLVSAWWLLLAYLLHTSGELCLSPVGLSAVTKLSVPSVVGIMMGGWFLASAYGSFLASELAILFSDIGADSNGKFSGQSFEALFNELFLYGVAAGIVSILIAPLIQRSMQGIH